MQPTIQEAKAALRSAKNALRRAEKTTDRSLQRICAHNVAVWKSAVWRLENPDAEKPEIDRLRAVLTKIARRKPCTYKAASAFYLCRRDAREVLRISE